MLVTVKCLFSIHEVLGLSPAQHHLGMLVYTYNPFTLEGVISLAIQPMNVTSLLHKVECILYEMTSSFSLLKSNIFIEFQLTLHNLPDVYNLLVVLL